MKSKKLRIFAPLAVLAIVSAGFALNTGVGTLSAIGWGDVSLLCPLGALESLLASKTLVPRALVSVVVAIAAILLLGRAFCAWICPVLLVSKLRGAFKKGPAAGDEAEQAKPAAAKPLSRAERAALKGCNAGCSSCADVKAKLDSRHLVLGGSLLSAAVFGFPVFCLICPIGLTFASILLLMLLFGDGDVTWSIIVAPALLLAEVVFFREWCSKICPLSAFMSLIGKLNRTFRPVVDEVRCLESAKGATCGICAEACEQHIDPRHPERGASWSECTKCRACVDACPAHAISMPLLAHTKRTGFDSAAEGSTGAADGCRAEAEPADASS